MAAYVIADIHITDQAKYDEYRRQVPATVAKFGGRFLARGGALEILEGTWQPTRLVLIEFPDMAALKAWYESPDYTPLIALRKSASTGNLLAVTGAAP